MLYIEANQLINRVKEVINKAVTKHPQLRAQAIKNKKYHKPLIKREVLRHLKITLTIFHKPLDPNLNVRIMPPSREGRLFDLSNRIRLKIEV